MEAKKAYEMFDEMFDEIIRNRTTIGSQDEQKGSLDRFKVEAIGKLNEKLSRKVAIKRGCPAQSCCCTGKCQEIIGWRDKLPNEH